MAMRSPCPFAVPALVLALVLVAILRHSRSEPRIFRCRAFCLAFAPVAVSPPPERTGSSPCILDAVLGGAGLGLNRIRVLPAACRPVVSDTGVAHTLISSLEESSPSSTPVAFAVVRPARPPDLDRLGMITTLSRDTIEVLGCSLG